MDGVCADRLFIRQRENCLVSYYLNKVNHLLLFLESFVPVHIGQKLGNGQIRHCNETWA